MGAIVSAMGHSASLPMGRSASLLLALLPQLADAASTTCGGGWYLANYINHELGTVPRYDSVNYGGNQPTSIPYGGELVSCPETCAGLGYGPATGARWACNYFGNDPETDIPQWDAEGCVPAYADGYENAPDGTDFPAETPGGANAHCSVMAYDIDGDGTSEIVKCVNSLTVEYTDAALYTGYPSSANGYSGYQGSWQTANMADLGWDFYHAFALECTVKDCTHASIHECVTGGNGCRDWLSGLAIQCYCEPVAENCPPLLEQGPPPPSPPPPPPTPATPPPFCGGKWYLGNYANHVVGQPADYKNTDYSGYVNCKETCDIIGGEATGARFACNTGTTWGCSGAWVGAQEDGYDYPSGGPGGHNTHCMTMVYDVDHDGNPDVVSCTDVGTIKYVSNANWAGYSAQNANNLDWQTKAVSELDWEFSHRFNEACVVKDCTHNDILTCVMANPNTGRAIGAGCNDWLNGGSYGLAIQCYCTKECNPPPPPEYSCDELAPNGARCGVDGNGTVCKYCCGATGYCGDGDLWCGDGADFIYSYKLRDPERSSCPRTPTRVEFEQYCTVNPATNNQLCVRLPAGKDFDDPMVVRRLEEVFARDTAAANPTPEPTPTPEASPSPSPEAEVRRRAADAGAADAGAAPTLVENVEVALAEDWRPSDAD